MSLDCPTYPICLLQTDKRSEDRLRDKRRSSHHTNQTYKSKICLMMYIFTLVREKIYYNCLLLVGFSWLILGADHLTLEGGVGDFEKKFPANACRKKKIACSTIVIEKNSCAAVRKKKKCCKAISSFRGSLKNRSKTATILFPCSLWTLDLMMLQNYCFICAMHY